LWLDLPLPIIVTFLPGAQSTPQKSYPPGRGMDVGRRQQHYMPWHRFSWVFGSVTANIFIFYYKKQSFIFIIKAL